MPRRQARQGLDGAAAGWKSPFRMRKRLNAYGKTALYRAVAFLKLIVTARGMRAARHDKTTPQAPDYARRATIRTRIPPICRLSSLAAASAGSISVISLTSVDNAAADMTPAPGVI